MFSIIAYLILFFITMIIIRLLPQLFGVILIIWMISTIVRVVQEVRRSRGNSRNYYQDSEQRTQQTNTDQTHSSNHNGDVIDVEYTTRDVTDKDDK